MIGLVLDTHAVIWLLHANKRLSSTALQAINTAGQQGLQVGISSISLVEAAYLEEKGRVPTGTLAGILGLLDTPGPLLAEISVDRQIMTTLLTISRADVPDMPDRVIAATAAHLAVPLISRDNRIRASNIQTIW